MAANLRIRFRHGQADNVLSYSNAGACHSASVPQGAAAFEFRHDKQPEAIPPHDASICSHAHPFWLETTGLKINTGNQQSLTEENGKGGQ
ncbi:MAG: hypothetical protein FIA99_14230 [Ruminiclostridium sp.]|nr:hypothetical protein [Ruminiclostridium sp.]